MASVQYNRTIRPAKTAMALKKQKFGVQDDSGVMIVDSPGKPNSERFPARVKRNTLA